MATRDESESDASRIERASADYLRQLSRLGVFRRLPPLLCSDAQPSSWLEDWSPLRGYLPRLLRRYPAEQLQGRRHYDMQGRPTERGGYAFWYSLWYLGEGPEQCWMSDDLQLLLFTPPGLRQAAELVAEQILDAELLEGDGDCERVNFIPRSKPY